MGLVYNDRISAHGLLALNMKVENRKHNGGKDGEGLCRPQAKDTPTRKTTSYLFFSPNVRHRVYGAKTVSPRPLDSIESRYGITPFLLSHPV